MRRILIIISAMLLLIAVLIAGGWTWLFHSAGGRDFLAGAAEPRLVAVFGGEVDIGALEGNPPSELRLRNVRFTESGEEWLHIDELYLRWRPLAALRKNIVVDQLLLDGATLSKLPPRKKETSTRDERPSFRLPSSFPSISINELSLADIHVKESLTGSQLDIAGAGKLTMGGKALSLRFDASSKDDTDVANLTVDLAPGAGDAEIDVLLASESDGFLSTILGLRGPLYIVSEGHGPLSNVETKLTADLGAYASLEGEIQINFETLDSVSFDIAAKLGNKLESLRKELGEDLGVTASITRNGEEIHGVIAQLTTNAGRVEGDITLNTKNDVIESVRSDMSVKFSEGYRSDIQKYVGDSAQVGLELNRARTDYDLEAHIETPISSVDLSNGKTDLRDALAGDIAMMMTAGESMPEILRGDLKSQAGVKYEAGTLLAIQNFSLTLNDASSVEGDGALDLTKDQISFDGSATFGTDIVQSLISGSTAAGPITASIAFEGPIDSFRTNISADLPQLSVNETRIPASNLTVSATGLPQLESADIRAKTDSGPGMLTARVTKPDPKSYVLKSISFEGASFKLHGRAAFNTEQESVNLDLNYHGEEGAEPWPGVPLTGKFKITGNVGRTAELNDLSIHAENIQSEKFSIGLLEGRASGASSVLRIELTADEIEGPVLGVANDLEVNAIANLDDQTLIKLTRFQGVVRGVDASLTSPATIDFSEGVQITSLRAKLGRNGGFSADGEFNSTKWQASLVGKNVPIGDGLAALTFDIDVDTSQKMISKGAFSVRSLTSKLKNASVGGKFVWDGASLHITNDNPDDPIEIDASLPLTLIRQPALSVEFDGPIEGEARYDGLIEPLAVYLPATLQSFEGDLKASVVLSGTVKKPEIVGDIAVNNGAYTELASGLSFSGITINAEAKAAPEGTRITYAGGAHGPGQTTETISAKGIVAVGENSSIESEFRLDNAKFSAGPVSSAVATGLITLSGPLDEIKAEGEVQVSELDAEIVTPGAPGLVDIEVIPASAEGEPAATSEPVKADPPPLILNISVKAPGRIFVRGRGLESEWKADIRATGPADDILINGSMTLERGFLDFSGRRFQLKTGRVVFDRLSPNNPVVNLRAEYETGEGVVAAIVIEGRAQSPSVSLTSTPSLPSEDVMALVLFGKPAAELSALESLQIAQALAQLSGLGPFGGSGSATGKARALLGLDMLNIALDSEIGSSKLEVGKYVADGLFVSATQDARGDEGSVRVEYQITNSITLETEIKQDGDQTVSANWKRDF